MIIVIVLKRRLKPFEPVVTNFLKTDSFYQNITITDGDFYCRINQL